MNLEFNPVTLALLALIGATTGAITTVGTYIAFRAAKEVGEEMASPEERIELPIPGSELKRLPLPHEILAALLKPAP